MNEDEQRVAELAAEISCDAELKRLVMQAKPELRKGVYEELCRHVTFKPKPFWFLRQ